jgi:hypothetical protein
VRWIWPAETPDQSRRDQLPCVRDTIEYRADLQHPTGIGRPKIARDVQRAV